MMTEIQSNMADEQSSISTLDPTVLTMVKKLRSTKTFKRTWDSDRALDSTYQGLFGKYQIRALLLLALGYGIIGAWLTKMPVFALLPPKYLDCTPIYPNLTNQSAYNVSGPTRKPEPTYIYSQDYGRSVLTDYKALCDKTRLKIPYVSYLIGLTLGGLIFGSIADYSGRKMVLLGSIWTACALSIFQLLSDDYISYVFFIFFIGVAIGAVQVIAIPYVMEMFSTKCRVIYGMTLVGVVFLLDLVLPWLALWIQNWKILQAVVSAPLIITAALYWFTEESIFWYTAQKDHVAAILSLTKIAKFNRVIFENVFREANSFLRGKCSKEVQCDFQPLLRLEEIRSLTTKYSDFNLADLQETANANVGLFRKISQIVGGHDYSPTLSTFYPTDFFQSSILFIYLMIMCGLWLVSSLTEYGLDTPQLTSLLTDSFHHNYFYTHLVQIISFIFALPLVLRWGRRWPTFSFFLIAEVCLLASIAAKADDQQIRSAMLFIYFTGKFATRAAFLVIIIYTCELFPTGLRCTALGICYTFRLIGIALASSEVGELNDWMARLVYGILSLVLGAMALLLPETKNRPLPRTMVHIEILPTTISNIFRRRRANRQVQSSDTLPETGHPLNDAGSVISATRSSRPYDNQSTLYSVYELQEYGPDDTIHSGFNRNVSRRTDLQNTSFYQQPNHGMNNNETYRQQHSIVESGESEDYQTRLASQRRLRKQRHFIATPNPVEQTDEDVIVVPVAAKRSVPDRQSTSHEQPTQLEDTQSGDVIGEATEITDERLSQSPRYQRALSQNENYFSEHC